MKSVHMSENDLQQYAIDKTGCPGEMIKHIEACSDCMSQVLSYQHLFSEIKEIPKPVFDFNLEDLVISKLPVQRPILTTDLFVGGFLAIFISCCIGIPVYIFRFNILDMFLGIPSVIIYFIIASTSISLAIKIFILYKNFRHKMHLLNFS